MPNDLISRSAVLEILTNNIVIHEDEIDLMEEVCHTIKAAPALDVAPVVHGEFERKPEEVIPNLRATPLLCKTCGTTFITINKEGKRCICCSYCGARMDGDAE